MSGSANSLHDLIEGLLPLYHLLEGSPQLDTSRRKALGRVLFEDAPRFVLTTAEVLCDSAELFPDIPIDGKELRAEQDYSDALQGLHAHLLLLSSLCRDAYLARQARAIEKAMAAVKRVRQDDEIPFPQGRNRLLRRLAMGKAELYLPANRRRLKQAG